MLFDRNQISIENGQVTISSHPSRKVSSENLKVCLVDHHVLAAKDAMFAPYVQKIFDHRQLENINYGGREWLLICGILFLQLQILVFNKKNMRGKAFIFEYSVLSKCCINENDDVNFA